MEFDLSNVNLNDLQRQGWTIQGYLAYQHLLKLDKGTDIESILSEYMNPRSPKSIMLYKHQLEKIKQELG